MLKKTRDLSILNKIFNVKGKEWHKIFVAWVISFFYRVGFVIGWTILVAMFVSTYGIYSLPYLFVLNALFTILGSLFFATFIDKFKRHSLMLATVFIAISTLFISYYFAFSNEYLFFGLLIITIAIFLQQFKIMLHAYVEDMFNPLQSERTFPLIEASITIAGIVGGILIAFLTPVISVPSFILIWIFILSLLIPCILLYEHIGDSVEKSKKTFKSKNPVGFFTKIKKDLKKDVYFKYIRGLCFIVLIQWILFNLLEFQYTKAVYQNVSYVILEAGSGFEHAFAHDLGQLFILFSASALIVQLFIGSRLINSLGVVGSMILHPIVVLLSVFGLIFSFSFPNAVLAKNNFTITSVIFTNAYHSSYYAIHEKIREYIREFLDGIIRPVGALLGTLILILLQQVVTGNMLVYLLNVIMGLIVLVFLYINISQQRKYSKVAISDLKKINDEETRLSAIDILAQKGHKDVKKYLFKILLDKKESKKIKLKVLEALSEKNVDVRKFKNLIR